MWGAHAEKLRCPLCFASLAVRGRSLVCAQNHTFDIARQGYAGFADGGSREYDGALWDARAIVAQRGFFDPVIEEIARIPGLSGFFVDAGCGDGSLTGRIAALTGGTPFGADLSREGVRRAAVSCRQGLWAVADLARLPACTGAADALVNILSPASYAEFRRVLRPGGVIVKAVPTGNHLRELRELWSLPVSQSAGQAERIFMEEFPQARAVTAEHTVFAGDWLPALAAMTPLAWHKEAPIPERGMAVTMSARVLWSVV